jgi:hypothetical protein
MKRSKVGSFKPLAIVAVGVVLGRGAQADTILDFDALPPGQVNNAQILAGFGGNAGASSPGVSVSGLGTPDITLTLGSSVGGTGGSTTRWDYYNDAVWSAGQLNGSTIGSFHSILFTPGASAAVSLESFNFHPYYVSAETFDYNWSVLDGATVLTGGSISFNSDATKNHSVNINFTGGVGEALTLMLDRTGGSGSGQNIAVDDIAFAQVPEPSTLALLSLGLGGLALSARRRRS